MKAPIFNGHVVVHANPVNTLLAVNENHHADDFDFFVDQEIPELIVGFVHRGIIIKKAFPRPRKLSFSGENRPGFVWEGFTQTNPNHSNLFMGTSKNCHFGFVDVKSEAILCVSVPLW